MNKLRAIIEEETRREGIITFARFMDLALYCPNIGYYERLEHSPGRSGDFFTSVSVGELFGEFLGSRLAEWVRELASPSSQVVEVGAHDGRLARDVLRHWRENQQDVFASTEYWIIEPSATRQESQARTLAEFTGRVRWFRDWNSVPAPGINGVIFSNELLDAMPVHRLGWDAKRREWFEWGVIHSDGKLAWGKIEKPSDSVPRPALPVELLAVLPDGFTTEVCPAATAWWRCAAEALRSGRLVTIDYGLEAEEFFSPERKDGTLRAYFEHHQTADLLARPGEQDLTAQVNFSAIRAVGEAAGLTTETFTTQDRFLTQTLEQLASLPDFAAWFAPRQRQFQTLTHPEHLGRRFKVLVQRREAPASG